jgi:hypothetical protein
MRTPSLLSVLALSGSLTFSVAAPALAQTAAGEDLAVSGALHENDPVDAQGRHTQTRSIVLRAGEGVEVAVDSDDFDTWVRVTGPGGLRLENDDSPGEGTNSRVRFRAPANGTYRVTVTSYRAGETGEYHLSVTRGVDVDAANDADDEDDHDAQDGAPTAAPGCSAQGCPVQPAYPSTGYAQQPVYPQQPAYGQPQQWVWDPSRNMYVAVQPGVPMPGAMVQAPNAYAAPYGAPGMYAVPGYGMPVQPGAGYAPVMPAQPGVDDPGADDPGAFGTPEPPTGAPNPAAGTGSVYGVFVGVSDYGGANDLQYTAQDARTLASAFQRAGLIRHGNAIVLTDGEATEANVRHAFQVLAPRVGERDTFVFFFDGHGSSNRILLRSGGMSSQEISRLLDGVRGQQLVVLDSCYSGSLASVVRGHPNRVGLFSSRADEVSYVASEVQAGGYLAYFMIQAVRGGASGGADGALQVGELASYVQRSYDQRVGGRQHLVVATGAGRQATLWRTVPGRADLAMN